MSRCAPIHLSRTRRHKKGEHSWRPSKGSRHIAVTDRAQDVASFCKRSYMSSLYQAKMKHRGVAVVPETKAGRELDKELADMRKRKATLEAGPCSSSGQ